MKVTFESLENALEYSKKGNPELKNIFLQKEKIVPSTKVALVRKGSFGSTHVITDLLPFNEMQQFLRGYIFKSEGKFDHFITITQQ